MRQFVKFTRRVNSLRQNQPGFSKRKNMWSLLIANISNNHKSLQPFTKKPQTIHFQLLLTFKDLFRRLLDVPPYK